MKGHSGNHLFQRSLLLNLGVCMVIVALVTPLCVSFYNAFYDYQTKNFEGSLQIMLNDLNTNLTTISTMASKNINGDLQRVRSIRGEPKSRDIPTIRKAQKYVSNLCFINPYLADCVAAFAGNNIILTRQTVFYSADEFAQFYYIEGSDYAQLLDNFLPLAPLIRFMPASRMVYCYKYEAQVAYNLAFCCYVPFEIS